MKHVFDQTNRISRLREIKVNLLLVVTADPFHKVLCDLKFSDSEQL